MLPVLVIVEYKMVNRNIGKISIHFRSIWAENYVCRTGLGGLMPLDLKFLAEAHENRQAPKWKTMIYA